MGTSTAESHGAGPLFLRNALARKHHRSGPGSKAV